MERDDERLAKRFAALPPEGQRGFLEKLRNHGLNFAELPIVPADRQGNLPISYAQRSLWLTWKLDPASPAYNMAGMLRFKGELDVDALLMAVQRLVERHETLRTIFQGDDEPHQVILPPNALHIDVTDLRQLPEQERAQQLRRLQQDFSRTLFQLDAEPPLRIRVWKLEDNEHVLGIVLHHIAGDGVSVGILIDELLGFYQRECGLPATSPEPLPVQFADYAVWQRNWFEAGEKKSQLTYWQTRLGYEHPPLELPFSRQRGLSQGRKEGHLSLSLPAELSDGLRALARDHNASVFMVMLALFKLLLCRFSGQSDVRVGAPIANRQRSETRGMIAYLTNMLVLRTRVDLSESFVHLLEAVRETVLEAHAHPDLPFDLLVEALQPERQPGVHPLFQVKCTQQDNIPAEWHLPGLDIEADGLSIGEAHFDLSLDFVDSADRIEAVFVYSQELFDKAFMARLVRTFGTLVKEVINAPDVSLHEVNIGERDTQLYGDNQAFTYTDVLGLWNESVRRFPDHMAIRGEDRAYRYAELDSHADRLAAALIAQGIGPDVRVGIYAERSCEFVLGALAVLKAGGAYVPLDPALPTERLVYQLRDSGAVLLLNGMALVWEPGIPVLPLDLTGVPQNISVLPARPLHPAQAAYVIYTSGSTGKPKGVVVSRGALANYVQAVIERMALPEETRSMAMVSTVAADLGHTVLFGALCSGRELHLISTERAFDPDAFAEYMNRHRVDVLKIVPSHLQALLHAGTPAQVLPALRLIVGGEATSWSLLARITNLKPDCRVLNHYGPTETTVGILTQEADEAAREAGTLPVGRPLANSRAYVLDADLNPVPMGVPGELYLGGVGVARGYQARAAQTAERFIANPFSAGERLYRTGDRVRMLENNSLEFLGRTDDQVKVRGYRVELREVAQVLRGQPDVVEAEVIARADDEGRTQLHGYVVARIDAQLDMAGLREAIAQRLPEYMVPAAIMQLDALPLTANGKIDRKALPEPTERAVKRYAAPNGEVEQALAGIWEEIFGLERVGRDDDFFELGGDSIIALKLVARARKRGVQVLPKQLFTGRTLAGVAQLMTSKADDELQGVAIPVLPAARRAGALSASYAQARQWFLWQLEPDSTAYHISGALRLRGVLHAPALTASFDALVARHESLRTVFRAGEDGQIQQLIQAEGRAPIETIDLSSVTAEERDERVQAEVARLHQTPFDLERGPLLRVGLIQQAVDDHVLVVVMHHIISDGWSIQIIIDEFAAQYRARVQGQTQSLAALPIQYADYAVWQRNWLEAGEQERQLTYWKAQLGNDHPVLQLPADHPRRADGRYTAAHHSIDLPTALVDALHARAQSEGATLFMVLLAAVQMLLHRYSGQRDIRIGVPIANRHRPETEGVVGFFVNTQVLSAPLHGRLNLTQVLTQAKEAALGAQNHQDLPFEQLVEALQPERNLGANPLFQVMFNHQRQDGRALEQLPGLSLEGYELGEQGAQFELTVGSSEDADGRVSVSFIYARELFEAETIERMVAHYQALLWALASAPQQALGEVQLLGESERQQLKQWGESRQHYINPEPVHRLIERQVRERPEAIAVLFGDAQLTYAELNRRANRLAHHLIARGVKPEVKVGIAVERSLEMVVGLLAILKAGGAYVPLDPEYPADRLAYMLEDSGLSLLLTQSGVRPQIPSSGTIEVLGLDTLDLGGEPEHNPAVAVHGEHLAYVIYTSGSTGKPKGVFVSHAPLAMHMQAIGVRYELTSEDRLLQFASISFDAAGEQWILPLMSGAAIVLPPERYLAFDVLGKMILNDGITVLYMPPAYLRQLTHAVPPAALPVRLCIAGGEAWSREDFERARRICVPQRMINAYGPAETIITPTVWSDEAAPAAGSTYVPVGRPVGGRKAFVLDDDLNLVPRGVVGELYLGGELLARGYLNRSGLSAERFIADPFDENGGRLYRSGDLVRWNGEGQLEYLGRIDHQIKIRGFRIELGEVEAQLLAQPEVREALVVAQPGPSGARLVGYVTAQAGQAPNVDVLRDRLSSVLPDYMVPNVFVVLESLPLNANGKVDRKALPTAVYGRGMEYEAPQGEAEAALASIWAEVLGIERVGRHDNFFELGGHSLAALRVVTMVRARGISGVALTLKDMLSRPTLHALAARANPLVLLNKNVPERTPLFCIHSGLGTVLGYLPLAKRLNGIRSVYGLACRTLIDPHHRDYSLESMADDYTAMIKGIQPSGPYRLLGWSLGSVLASLIAARLESDGQTVDFLGLVDPPVPSEFARNAAKVHWRANYINFLERVGELNRDCLHVPDNVCDPLESERPLLEWTRSLIATGAFVPQGAFEGIPAEDLARTGLMSRNLALAIDRFSGSLDPVRAAIHCWWVEKRSAAEIGRASRELRGHEIHDNYIDADHESIIYSPAFIEGVMATQGSRHIDVVECQLPA